MIQNESSLVWACLNKNSDKPEDKALAAFIILRFKVTGKVLDLALAKELMDKLHKENSHD